MGAVKPAFEDVLRGFFWLSSSPRYDQIEAPTQFGNNAGQPARDACM